MARVWSVDGHVYEIDEETLEKHRIPDEQVRAMQMEPLPPAPPPKPLAPGKGGPAPAAHEPRKEDAAEDSAAPPASP